MPTLTDFLILLPLATIFLNLMGIVLQLTFDSYHEWTINAFSSQPKLFSVYFLLISPVVEELLRLFILWIVTSFFRSSELNFLFISSFLWTILHFDLTNRQEISKKSTLYGGIILFSAGILFGLILLNFGIYFCILIHITVNISEFLIIRIYLPKKIVKEKITEDIASFS